MAWTVVGTITLAGDYQILNATPRNAWGLEALSFRGDSVTMPFAPLIFVQQSFDFPSTGWTQPTPVTLSGGANGRTFGERTYFPYISPVQGEFHISRVASGDFSGMFCNVWAFVR